MLSLPKAYRVQATLQAQRNTVMPALSNPTRAIPIEADTPTRQAAEVSSITEAITILEARAEQAREALTASVQQLQALCDERGGRSGARVRRAGTVARPAAPVDQEISRLLVTVQSKRRAIADLEEFRRRRVTELQTKLQEQRAIYAQNHPVVLDIEQSLAAV